MVPTLTPTAAELLAEVRETLTEDRWTDNRWVGNTVRFGSHGSTYEHCLLGHLGLAYGLHPSLVQRILTTPVKGVRQAIALLAGVIREQYPDRVLAMPPDMSSTPEDLAMGFNDFSGTTFADVQRVVEKALIRATEIIGS